MLNLHSNIDYASQPILVFHPSIQYGNDIDSTCLNYCMFNDKIYKSIKPKSDTPLGVFDPTKFESTTDDLRESPVSTTTEMIALQAREFAKIYVQTTKETYHFKLTDDLTLEEDKDVRNLADTAATGKWVIIDEIEEDNNISLVVDHQNQTPNSYARLMPIINGQTIQEVADQFDILRYVVEASGYWGTFELTKDIKSDVWLKNNTNVIYAFEPANNNPYYINTGTNADKTDNNVHLYCSSAMRISSVKIYGIKSEDILVKHYREAKYKSLDNISGTVDVVEGSKFDDVIEHHLVLIKNPISLKAGKKYDITVSTTLSEVYATDTTYKLKLTKTGMVTDKPLAETGTVTKGSYSGSASEGLSQLPVQFIMTYIPEVDQTVRLDLFGRKSSKSLNHPFLADSKLTYEIREIPEFIMIDDVPDPLVETIEPMMIELPITDNSITNTEAAKNDVGINLLKEEGYITVNTRYDGIGVQTFYLPFKPGLTQLGQSSYSNSFAYIYRAVVHPDYPERLEIWGSFDSNTGHSTDMKSIRWYKKQKVMLPKSANLITAGTTPDKAMEYDHTTGKLVNDPTLPLAPKLYLRGSISEVDSTGTIKFDTHKGYGITVDASTGKMTVPVDGYYEFTLHDEITRIKTTAYIGLIAFNFTDPAHPNNLSNLTPLTGATYNEEVPKNFSGALHAPKRNILSDGSQAIGMTWSYYLKAGSELRFYYENVTSKGKVGIGENYSQLLITGVEEK